MSAVTTSHFVDFKPIPPRLIRQRYPVAGTANPKVRAGIVAIDRPDPIAWVALTSLKTKDGQWAHPGDFSNLNLGNYSKVLSDTDFLTWFRNSIIVSVDASPN